ncbi:uncharacterized protein B0P05DRAFT_528499 [Gilbertella persicaria]|uniref:uncharacterized protein n=1 Tax=Gilbertella persicaria TaxID=101096 RepID=UPI00221F1930|nr:uncharacterized protein B0P05DRAFT_528499 [Gilbertella persicaria]KAI8091042.1 hypothetical protein B0P05DRAFT_528499 [Gilbertella persicaria]
MEPFTPFQQWEIAFIYSFACTFNKQHDIAPNFFKLPDFTPEELEQELRKEESELVHGIICACLGNTLNRKNPVESYKMALQQLVQDKIKAYEIDFESNPLVKQPFSTLSIDIKLSILRSLVEWQLQDSQAVKNIIEFCYNNTPRNQINPIKARPIGTDSKKRAYWQFGASCWIWREKINTKKLNEWETVCRDRQELEALVETLSETKHRSEKALAKWIKETLYQIADEEERRKLRKERAELRKAIPVEINITPTQLRSRGNRQKRVHYNYDDIYEEMDNDRSSDFEEEEDIEEITRKSKRLRVDTKPPTRWSSRLNREPTNEQNDIASVY